MIADPNSHFNTNTNPNTDPSNIGTIQLTATTSLSYLKSAPNPYTLDIIPGVYQGGYKIWQCTLDLLKYISQCTKEQNWCNKTVMDIGCGCGLIGIAAIKYGAQFCYFQDYNIQVLQNVTQNNVVLNNIDNNKCAYIAGDWQSLSINNNTKFDIIVGSQIIYKQQNYQKITNLCKKYLKQQTGIAIFANKCYYFGVGGNMDDFRDVVQENGFYCRTLRKIQHSKGGNKKQIVEIGWNNNKGQGNGHNGMNSEMKV